MSSRPDLRHQYLRDRAVLINPSILSADFARLAKALKSVESAGCRWIHLDVMDGHFVPNLTFGPPVVKSLKATKTPLFLDAHLMIEQPGRYLKEFVDAGADLVTVHVESEGRALDHVNELHDLGVYAGVSIKPGTPVEALEEVLPIADLILVMTVEPGFGGQSLIPTTLSKVGELARRRRESGARYLIEIDGGVNVETTPLAVAAGAEILVAGSAVFKGHSVGTNVRALREAVARA